MPTTAAVRAALGAVRDPELDEPLPDLGFVASIDVDGPDVRVALRLPTYYCAPNFAYLMVADARRAVASLPGVRSTAVVLDDHFSGSEITRAVADGSGFAGAFPGETDGTLEELRLVFARKALLARQSRMCDELRSRGVSLEDDLPGLTVADLPPGPDAERALELRRQLGIASGPRDPAIVRPNGEALTSAELERFLRMARLVRTSLEGNGSLCRGLLATRYDVNHEPEEVAA